MQRHFLLTVIIIASLIFGFVYIYPTAGWLTLSEEQRAERIAKWHEEDSQYHQPSAWADAKKTVKR